MTTPERIAELYRVGVLTDDDVYHYQYKSEHPLAFRLRKRAMNWQRRTFYQFRAYFEAAGNALAGAVAPLMSVRDDTSFPRWFLLLMSPFLFALACWFSIVVLLIFPIVAGATAFARVTELHWQQFRLSKSRHQ